MSEINKLIEAGRNLRDFQWPRNKHDKSMADVSGDAVIVLRNALHELETLLSEHRELVALCKEYFNPDHMNPRFGQRHKQETRENRIREIVGNADPTGK